MADTKISGLPASTTPLAGTEVLPIVQAGTTKQVSVANLTAGRDVSANIFSSAAGAVATPSITTTGDTNTGIWFPAADTIAASTAGTERMRIASNGVISLGAAVNSESLRVTPVASAVNYWSMQGNVTTGGIYLNATGSDTNVFAVYSAKGAGSHTFQTAAGAATQFVVNHTASAVNYLQVTGNAAGSYSSVSAQGSDTNTGIGYISKGSGYHFFATNGGTATQFLVNHTASAVNYLQVTGGSTGNAPILLSTGSNANVNFTMQTKGTGSYYIYGGGAYFYNNSSAPQFAVVSTASAVNYISVFGAPTGSGGYFQAAGSDTNIPLVYSSKGNREHAFYTDGNSFTQQFRIAHTASAVNYLQVTGNATGFGPSLTATGSDTNIPIYMIAKGASPIYFIGQSNNTQFAVTMTASAVNYASVSGGTTGNAVTFAAGGSDTNIDLALTPKGTGVLKYGTYTAGILAQAGYITIKDAGGTTRNLLVG